jgi:hypothetical protein
MSHQTVLSARKALRDAKVPVGAPLYFFLGTGAIMDLLQLPEYRDADKTGDSNLAQNAPIAFRRYGMQFIESQYVQTVASTVRNLCLTPKEGLALATRPLPLPPGGVISAEVVAGIEGTNAANLGIRQIQSYQGLKLGVLLTTDVLFGWKVIRGAFGQDVAS